MSWKIYRYYDMIADDLDFELYCSECGYVAWNETAEDDCPVCSEKKRKRMERKDERTENAAESGKQKEKGSGTSECKPGNSEGTGSANGRAGTETGLGCYGNGSLGGCGK